MTPTRGRRLRRALRRHQAETALLRRAFDHASLAILTIDPEGTISTMNPAARELLGADLRGVPGGGHSVLAPEAVPRVVEAFEAAHHGNGTFAVDADIVRPDGSRRPTRLHVRLVSASMGHGPWVPGMVTDHSVVVLVDTTVESDARQTSTRLAWVFDQSADLVLLLGTDGSLLFANQVALLHGTTDRDTLGIFSPASQRRLRGEVLAEVMATGHWTGELVVAPIPDYEWPANVTVAAHRDEVDRVEFISLVAHDISELKAAQARLQIDASHDSLTGLPNRTRFVHLLENSLRDRAQHADTSNRTFAVLFCDLDGFKAVNDGMGHEVGDELLQEVGRRLVAELRSGDVVARFGGDEFVVLLADLASPSDAAPIAEKLVRALERPFPLSAGEAHIGLSVGLALAEPDSTTDELLRQADLAMYEAKISGKGMVRAFDHALRQREVVRVGLAADLSGALGRGEFSLNLTPVFDLQAGAVIAFEASAFWNHPVKGRLGPRDWLSLAAETGDRHAIERWTLQVAVEQGLGVNEGRSVPLPVWATVSGQSLLRRELTPQVLEALADQGAPPGLLGIEVSLGSVARYPDASREVFAELHRAGVRLALDDVGEGPVPVVELAELPIDTVKLARTLTFDLAENPRRPAAVAAVVRLANSLGWRVVAKGIEQREQIAVLLASGCTRGQGDLLAPTIPAEDARSWLTAQRSGLQGQQRVGQSV